MFIFAVLLLFGNLDQLLADPRSCTAKDFCIDVPDGTCDKSLCQPYDFDQFAEFGRIGFKVYTYTIGQKAFIRYCPLKFQLETSQSYDGLMDVNVNITLNSGPFCNISTSTNKFFSYRPDPAGLIDSEILVEARDNYDTCFVYFDPGVAFVIRICRVEYGQECATFYVAETTNGTCNRDKLDKFLKNSGIDFKEIAVDCL